MLTLPRRHLFALAALFLVSLGIRTISRFALVFRPDGILFPDSDAWYHVRGIDHLLHNFPHQMPFDPYAIYPGGMIAAAGPLYDYLVAAIVLVAGLGSPSTTLMETIAAWFPAVLAALIPVPVYFVGRLLFSGTAGLLAAALVAVLPGHFLRVTSLGVSDHHVLESFLYALLLLCFVHALNAASSQPPEPRRVVLGWTALCGLTLGAYLLTWVAGSFFVGILAGWTLLACLVRHWRGQPCGDLVSVVTPALGAALLLFLPAGGVLWAAFTYGAVAAGIAGILLVAGLSALFRSRGLPRITLYLALLVIAAASAGLFLWLAPGPAAAVIAQLSRLAPRGTWSTINELRPLLHRDLIRTVLDVWNEFTLSGFLSAAALALLAERTLAGRPGSAKLDSGFGLFLFWSGVVMGVSLLQVRMCYYSVINVALLTGFLCSLLLEGRRPTQRGLIAAAIFLIVFLPNAWGIREVTQTTSAPSADWVRTLNWLRTATPEPFGDAAYFHRRYVSIPGEYFPPPSAYGIMNWWDEGYWIIYLGRRIPVASPNQFGAPLAARFYMAQDEPSASAILRQSGARYVLTDSRILVRLLAPGDGPPQTLGRLPSMARWAGTDPGSYTDGVWEELVEGVRGPVMVYYPSYFRSMAVRLHVFDGQAVTPKDSTWVIGTKQKQDAQGPYRGLSLVEKFPTYEAAAGYLGRHKEDPSLRIVSLDGFRSCVPLEPLGGFRREFASGPGPVGQGEVFGTVKVFSYAGAR
ncbi:MAG: STT3 domain-containing protein [Bryobacterales bacterium]|nr:STT3 domain-containing protein [Bryobacterales bacterium]